MARKIAGLRAEMPARQFIRFYRSSARSRNLAYAAPSPACAAAAASRAASAASHSAATAPTATAAATATSTNNNSGELHVAAGVFLIEEIERGETDVGHFLFAKNEALIGRDVVGLREIRRGDRIRGCAAPQRKSQSGCTECRCSGGFGCARVLRSLLHPWHGRILRCSERVDLTQEVWRTSEKCNLAHPVPPGVRVFLNCSWDREGWILWQQRCPNVSQATRSHETLTYFCLGQAETRHRGSARPLIARSRQSS